MTKPSEQLLLASEEVNRAQRERWTNEGPRQYQEYGLTIEAGFAPFGRAMFDAARLRPGERVLDVGCGFGTTTIEAADCVAPSGRVLGVDISAAMLEPARQRVAAAGIGNIGLLEADAQVHPFDVGAFDVVISRFGLMFFEDPDVAFANLARALRPGGRLVFVCWPDPMKSEWVAVALGVAVAQVGRPPDLGPPGAPGTFAFADGDRLTRLLDGAGFRDVGLEAVIRPLCIGRDVDDAAGYIMSMPESHQLFAGEPDGVVAAALDALRAAFAPYAGPHGVVMDGTAWLASARR